MKNLLAKHPLQNGRWAYTLGLNIICFHASSSAFGESAIRDPWDRPLDTPSMVINRHADGTVCNWQDKLYVEGEPVILTIYPD